MYENERKDDARYYFGKFSSLIHRRLKYADKTETTLAEELAFVRDYLILQKRRFNDDLEFSIEADEAIDLEKIKIPHSLIYTFAENAVKHGLRNKKGSKKLTIRIKRQADQTVITITDNGIGRRQSRIQKTTGTGKGMEIIQSIIESYNKLYNRSVSFTITDLKDGQGNSLGTEVVVEV
jgi:LytS/YehU family sensor histidine kinase